MKRLMVLGATLAACLAVPLSGSAAGPAPTTCPQDTQTFTGSAATLIVPANGYCAITNATIAQDLVLQDSAGADLSNVTIGRDLVGGEDAGAGIFDSSIGGDLNLHGADGGADLANAEIGHDYLLSDGAGTHMERTTIGHDFDASQPSTVQTGMIGPDTPGGPVNVGHDVVIDGSPADNPFVFDGICDLNVGHDMRVTNRTVTLGFGIASGGCLAFEGLPGNTIGHDLVVTGNTAASGFFGPSTLRIGDDHVGHDLIFSGNNAVTGGSLEVTNNVVGHDALCSSNTPVVTATEPNSAGHINTCG
ncbi:MAG TPA: hypothetical protein VGH82_10770 [Gaiellaceae bacterium]|jgi:hypothetical protein